MDADGGAANAATTNGDSAQQVLNSLFDQVEALLQQRAYVMSPEDLEAAAADLPVFMTEVQSIKVLLRHLYPDAVGTAPMRGLVSLSAAVQVLEQRSEAVKEAVENSERRRQHRRTACSPVAQVLTSNELLTSILSFIGAGNYLFIAPVSKRMRALYVACVASVHKATSAHLTVFNAAVVSQSRLNLALLSTQFTDALPALSDAARYSLCLELGKLGSSRGRRAHGAGRPQCRR
eukprot:TRINITY_DN8637_c0_g2_i1.p1 TRINITY_DN8637_c0_g2~~TRINITY_DN8637_c0_g2_i1.p1  ORF type:complete len:249 (+),score=39.12 TRINITY_DN8637_c0_g2_i1:46-747(+)